MLRWRVYLVFPSDRARRSATLWRPCRPAMFPPRSLRADGPVHGHQLGRFLMQALWVATLSTARVSLLPPAPTKRAGTPCRARRGSVQPAGGRTKAPDGARFRGIVPVQTNLVRR